METRRRTELSEVTDLSREGLLELYERNHQEGRGFDELNGPTRIFGAGNKIFRTFCVRQYEKVQSQSESGRNQTRDIGCLS